MTELPETKQIEKAPTKEKKLKLGPFDWITAQTTHVQLLYVYDDDTDEEFYCVSLILGVKGGKVENFPIMLETSIRNEDAILAAHDGIVLALQLSNRIYGIVDILDTDGEFMTELNISDVIAEYEDMTGEISPASLYSNDNEECQGCAICSCADGV